MKNTLFNIIAKLNRSRGKDRRITINAFFAFLVKGGALIVSLFTLPAYMRFFENQLALGFWFTALSLLTWILTFDLGIGNGLRNRLVVPLTQNDFIRVKSYISSAYVVLGFFTIIISAFGYASFQYINWNSFFNISPNLISTITMLGVVRLVFIGIMMQFCLRLISSILYAMQKSYISGLLLLITNTLLLIFVLLADSGDLEKNLKMLSFAYIVIANLPLIVMTLYLFLTKLKRMIPSIKYFRKAYAIDIFRLGATFFWLQLMFMVIYSTNEYLITFFIGPEKVVDYKIYNSLFAIIGTMFALALTPVWSEVTDALAQKEYRWIEVLHKRLNTFVLIAVVVEFFLIIILQNLINFWLAENAITVNYKIAIIFAVSGSLFIWNAALSSIINGLGKLKTPFVFLTLGAVINIPLAYMFVLLTNSWVSIILANIISILPSCVMQEIWLNKYLKQIIIKI